MGLILYYKNESPPVRSVKLCITALNLSVKFENLSSYPGEIAALNSSTRIFPQSTPILQDDSLVLCDSHAINSYLVSVYGQDDSLYPRDPKVRAFIDQQMYFECGTLFVALKEIAVDVFRKKSSELNRELIQKVHRSYSILDRTLEGQRYIAYHDVTIADFSIFSSLSMLAVIVPDLENYMHLKKYLDLCKKTMIGYDKTNDDASVDKIKALYDSTLEKNKLPQRVE